MTFLSRTNYGVNLVCIAVMPRRYIMIFIFLGEKEFWIQGPIDLSLQIILSKYLKFCFHLKLMHSFFDEGNKYMSWWFFFKWGFLLCCLGWHWTSKHRQPSYLSLASDWGHRYTCQCLAVKFFLRKAIT